MKKTFLMLLLGLALAIPVKAQRGNTVTIRFPGAPTGACAPLSFGINSATGALYDCVAGSWVLVGSPGGGGTIGGSIANTQVAVGSGVNTIAGSAALTYNGALHISSAAAAAAGETINIFDDDSFNLSLTNTAAPAGAFFNFGLADVGTSAISASSNGVNNIGLVFDPANLRLNADQSNVRVLALSTTTNCADSAGAAACGSAAAGAFVVDAAASTVVVSTTAVTANSEIFVQYDSSLGTRLGITCNTTVALPAVTARTAGASFTVTVPVGPITNPACYTYHVVN
jgi:hypothetical protein